MGKNWRHDCAPNGRDIADANRRSRQQANELQKYRTGVQVFRDTTRGKVGNVAPEIRSFGIMCFPMSPTELPENIHAASMSWAESKGISRSAMANIQIGTFVAIVAASGLAIYECN